MAEGLTVVVTTSWPRTADEIAGTFVRTDAVLRARCGARVIVLAPDGPGRARGGVPVIDVPHARLFGSPGAAERLRASPSRMVGLAPFARGVSRALASLGPARVVAHWLIPSGAIVRACSSADCEIVAHGADVRLLEAMPRAIAARTIAWLADGARIRAVSATLAERITTLHSVPLDVAPMPLADLHEARARSASLRASVGPYALIAARMTADKRIDRAFAETTGTLVMLGDGPLRERLVARARRSGLRVIAPGAVPHEDALSWIAGADLVLAPLARGEGAPTIVREAEALGVRTMVFA